MLKSLLLRVTKCSEWQMRYKVQLQLQYSCNDCIPNGSQWQASFEIQRDRGACKLPFETAMHCNRGRFHFLTNKRLMLSRLSVKCASISGQIHICCMLPEYSFFQGKIFPNAGHLKIRRFCSFDYGGFGVDWCSCWWLFTVVDMAVATVLQFENCWWYGC